MRRSGTGASSRLSARALGCGLLAGSGEARCRSRCCRAGAAGISLGLVGTWRPDWEGLRESGVWLPVLLLLVGVGLMASGRFVPGLIVGSLATPVGLAIAFYWLQEGRRGGLPVTVRLPASADYGTPEERMRYQQLAEVLEERTLRLGVGSYDGDGAGDGTFDLYFYGSDQQRLARALREGLKLAGVSGRVETE